jgi:hypothetical protein
MGYDNWKCTDPSLEGADDWEWACEQYEYSPGYEADLARWIKEAEVFAAAGETFGEDDYRASSAYESIIEDMLQEDGF